MRSTGQASRRIRAPGTRKVPANRQLPRCAVVSQRHTQQRRQAAPLTGSLASGLDGAAARRRSSRRREPTPRRWLPASQPRPRRRKRSGGRRQKRHERGPVWTVHPWPRRHRGRIAGNRRGPRAGALCRLPSAPARPRMHPLPRRHSAAGIVTLTTTVAIGIHHRHIRRQWALLHLGLLPRLRVLQPHQLPLHGTLLKHRGRR
mmetsp:Transcript_88746/g.157214  ORF Transcript_88746/g.157214 Transcript_88746/m.157214 type:complete len:203 (+) Transcript_88746:550-1158(+)